MLYLLSNQTESKPSRTEIKAHAKSQRRKGYAKFFFWTQNVFALICTKEKHSEN